MTNETLNERGGAMPGSIDCAGNGIPQREATVKGAPKLELQPKAPEENPANIFFAKLLEAHQIIGKQDLIIRNLQEANKALQEKLNNKQERQ